MIVPRGLVLYCCGICLLVILSGCTTTSEEEVAGAKVSFVSGIDPVSPTLGSFNLSPHLLISPYLTNNEGEGVIGGFDWPGDPNLTVEYEIWSLNCLVCTEEEYVSEKGTLVYRGSEIVNRSSPSVVLDVLNYPPLPDQASQVMVPLKFGDNYVVFATITTPEGRQFAVVGEGSGLFPPREEIRLGPHRSCNDNTDCRTGWLCCHRTCKYETACS